MILHIKGEKSLSSRLGVFEECEDGAASPLRAGPGSTIFTLAGSESPPAPSRYRRARTRLLPRAR